MAQDLSVPLLHTSVPDSIYTASTWIRKSKGNQKIQLKDGDTILAFDVGKRNLAECVLQVNMSSRPPFKILHWELNDLGCTKTKEVVEALCKLSTFKSHWLMSTYVLIEQQKHINTTMVAVSHALQAVLLCKAPALDVRFVSSASKFVIFKKMASSVLIHHEDKSLSISKRKTIRKKNAIRVCTCMLEALPEESHYLLQFGRYKKQDDLADAFIYASAFIYKHEPI